MNSKDRNLLMQHKRKINYIFGHDGKIAGAQIPISHIPVDQESLKLTCLDTPLIPNSFDAMGIPCFSKEAALILHCKEKLTREGRMPMVYDDDFYVKASFKSRNDEDISLDEINTVEGISKSLTSLESFNELCIKRKVYANTHSFRDLNGFIIYGRIYLDEVGCVQRISTMRNHFYGYRVSPSELPIVISQEEFYKIVTAIDLSLEPCIPKANDKCPCCGKPFTISSLQEELVLLDGNIAHEQCLKTYEYYAEIEKIIFDIIDVAFASYRCNKAIQFDIIPHPSARFTPSLAHMPWFLVHLSYGDIKIGSLQNKITIEWQENYPAFKIDIFDNLTQIRKEGRIDAWGYAKKYSVTVDSSEQAILHLKAAHNFVSTSRK